MTYFLTLLDAAGILNIEEVNKLEAQILRKQKFLPNDIKSAVIRSVLDEFDKSLGMVIAINARKNRLFIGKANREDARATQDEIFVEEEALEKVKITRKNSR